MTAVPATAWNLDAIAALGVTTDVVTAGQVLGIGRTHAYGLARRGEFPVRVVRAGRLLRVPTYALLALLDGERGERAEP